MMMKPIWSLAGTAMMMLFLCSAGAQIRLEAPKISPLLKIPPTTTNVVSTNLDLGSNQPQGRLFKPLPPAPETPLLQTPFPAAPETNSVMGRLPPGVYETRPYAGIVIVPGPQHDDCSVLGAGSPYPASRMPIIHPKMDVIHPHIEVVPKGNANP